MKQIVKWADGQIVVRSGLVEDEIIADRIERQTALMYAATPDVRGHWNQFGKLCSQTESSAGLTFHPEQVRNLDPQSQRIAYEEFVKIPKAVRNQWQAAIALVDDVKDVVLSPYFEGTDPKA